MAGLMENVQVGRREDLADFVAIVDAKKTPFTSMVRKGPKPLKTIYDWQVDKYEAPKITGTVDGKDVEDYENAAQNRAALHNYVQIFRRTAKVSRLAQEVSNVAGIADEMANSIAKKLVEIKRDMEAACLSNNECQADDGTNPYLLRGLGQWILATAQSVFPVPAAYRPASAQICTTATASLVETDVQTVLAAIFDATGLAGDYKLLAGSTLRRAFTDFTRTGQYANTNTAKVVRVFNGEVEDKTVSATTTVFEGDYGNVEVVSSSFIAVDAAGAPTKTNGLLVDFDKVELGYNKRPAVERLPDLGGGPRALVEAVAGLKVTNPVGMGKFKP